MGGRCLVTIGRKRAGTRVYRFWTYCLGVAFILRLNISRKFLASLKPHCSRTVSMLVAPRLNSSTAL